MSRPGIRGGRTLPAVIFGLALAGVAHAQSVQPAQPAPRGVAAGKVPHRLLVFYNQPNGRVVELKANQSLPLAGRNEMEVWLGTVDAAGRPLPEKGMRYQLVPADGCAGRYEISNITWHRFLVRVVRQDNSGCPLYARLISPRALERAVPVTWSLGGGANYGRDEAEFVADRLYRALLERAPDREGFYSAVQKVDSGGVADVIVGMFDSQEFAAIHRGWSTTRLLDSIYRGLLGRVPDASASANRNRLADRDERVRVVLEILASREFTALLNRDVVAVDPCERAGDPLPCELRVFYERGDGRTVMLGQDQRLDLGADTATQIWIETFDQYGRELGGSALDYRVLSGYDCSSEIDVHPLSHNRYSLRLLDRDDGDCRLVVRLDAPRRLDRAIDVSWDAGYRYGYDGNGATYERDDAEYIVDRLYRSLLQRPASQADFDDAVGRVQDGELRSVVDDLTSSPEFLSRERARSSDGLLRDLYLGLVQRVPADSESYGRQRSTADYLAIVLQLLSSPEFRELLERRR